MKKYRIVKISDGSITHWEVQEKFLFWWVDAFSSFGYVHMFYYYDAAYSALLTKINGPKKEIVYEL